jgi:hypothetical protein
LEDGRIVLSGADEFWLGPDAYHWGLRNIEDADLILYVADQLQSGLAAEEKLRFPTEVVLRICARVLELCLPNATPDERITIERLQRAIERLQRRPNNRPHRPWYYLEDMGQIVEDVKVRRKEIMLREKMKYYDALVQALKEVASDYGMEKDTLRTFYQNPGRLLPK